MYELVMLQSGIIFADISSQDASFILNCVYSVILFFFFLHTTRTMLILIITRQSSTAVSALGITTWKVNLSARKVVPCIHWPATHSS